MYDGYLFDKRIAGSLIFILSTAWNNHGIDECFNNNDSILDLCVILSIFFNHLFFLSLLSFFLWVFQWLSDSLTKNIFELLEPRGVSSIGGLDVALDVMKKHKTRGLQIKHLEMRRYQIRDSLVLFRLGYYLIEVI